MLAFVCNTPHTNHRPPNEDYWDALADVAPGTVAWRGAWSDATAYVADDVVYLSPSVVLSNYALCTPDDVIDLLGYDVEQASLRQNTIIRSINGVSKAIKDRSQREFVSTAAEQAQTRVLKITVSDMRRGYIRMGDLQSAPTAASLLSPERDNTSALDVDLDFWLLPDTPEPGLPFEYLRPSVLSNLAFTQDWWLSVTADWGFAAIPDDIVLVAIGSAAAGVLNDVSAMSSLAREQGRRVSFDALIPSEYLPTVDNYRLFRVS